MYIYLCNYIYISMAMSELKLIKKTTTIKIKDSYNVISKQII